MSNLQKRISKSVVKKLRDEVRPRGMKLWLPHEVLAKGLFNLGWSSGTAAYEAWEEPLTNGADDELDP